MSSKKKTIKNSKPQNQKEFIFDENSFDFSVFGGPIHTDLLIVKAIYKHGIRIRGLVRGRRRKKKEGVRKGERRKE